MAGFGPCLVMGAASETCVWLGPGSSLLRRPHRCTDNAIPQVTSPTGAPKLWWEGVASVTGAMQEVEVAADVDFEAVAQMCEGYSGDDMTNICRDAAMNGMRNLIAGNTPDQIR